MKIFVTGATGYIGSHVVKALAEHGLTVTGTDNNLRQNNITKYVDRFIDWDIRYPMVSRLGEYDAVVHLAAKTMVGVSIKEPKMYYDTNIFGTRNVADAIGSIPNFIYCSTGVAINPTSSPYAMSKKVGEDVIAQLGNYSICRFYNVSGNNGFNKFDNDYNHLIRRAAATVNGRFKDISIFGNNYDTPDGTAIRNYTHINDIVDSVLRIVHHGATNSIENLGNTTGYSVLEVIKSMEKVSGTFIPIKIECPRVGDIARTNLPAQSVFFNESHTLDDQCRSALENER